MKTFEKMNTYTNRQIILLLAVFSVGYINAQTITIWGSGSSVQQNITVPYTLDLDGANLNDPDVEEYYWTLDGTIISGSINSTTVDITWTTSGDHTIQFHVDTYVNDPYESVVKNVNVIAPQLPIGNPVISNQECAQATLNINETPTSYVTWFWQGKANNGTSTTQDTSTPYIANQGTGTYYLRARNDWGAWSASSKSVYIYFPQAPIWYEDQDGDGLGDPNSTVYSCDQPSGYVDNGDDPCPSSSNVALLSNKNYVYNVSYKNGYSELESGCATTTEKIENVTYFDGLGRPMQVVGIRSGGNSEDIVTHIGYDDFGRQAKDHLPYAITTNGGVFNATANNDVLTFYGNSAKYENTPNPFSEKNLESSPINRIMEQGAPGTDWALNKTSDADHTIKFEYGTNTNFDHVRQFRVNLSSGVPVLEEDNNAYSPGELFKTITKDENWQPGQEFHQEHTTEEYKDKQGRVVLKRSFDKQKWLSTYYVYDDYGNLTYVLPPKAVSINANENTYSGIEEWGNNNTFIMGTSEGFIINIGLYNVSSGQILSSGLFEDFNMNPQIPDMILGYFMGQDSNGNPAPAALVYFQNGDLYFDSTGVGLEPNGYGEADFSASVDMSNYIANTIDASTLSGLCYKYRYDDRNRLIEKRIPGKDKEYIVYDNLDRPVLTQDGNQRKINNPGLTNDQWLFTKYDAFGRVAYTGIFESNLNRGQLQGTFDGKSSPEQIYEERVSSGTGYNASFYTNQDYPNTDIEILKVNYYDDYGFYGPSLPTSALGQGIVNNDDADKLKTRGLPTGAKVKVLGKPNWITTVTGYDKKGRAIYVKSENNYLNTTDVIESKLDFLGMVLETKTSHEKGTNDPIETLGYFTYDHMGRLISKKQNIDGLGDELIVFNKYDDLGQLEWKKVGGAPAANIESSPGLQTVDYKYNIRGWLKEINTPGALGNDLFAFKINYNTVDHHSNSMLPDVGVPLYNGNIAETEWQTANADNTIKWYRYEYDALNRITFALDNAVHYVLHNVVYDKNGNISTLARYGLKEDTSNAYGGIDNLIYTYAADSNKLLGVKDNASSNYKAYGFNDGNNSSYDYGYDVNGNMTSDDNKGITSISYNHLNLPDEVKFGGTDKIKYFYDATGVKLEKKVTENSSNTHTYYAGNYVYRDTGSGSSLKFFNHAEGYVDAENGYEYIYQYKDHLGNVRLSYKDNNGTLEILEENNYYPFGLKHKGYNNVISGVDHPYGFGGKEEQNEFNNTLQWLDFGARNYDASLGRWMNIDPAADVLESSSQYVYALNSPIVYLDLDGELPILINGKVGKDSERGDESYWTTEIVATIKGSGIANPGGDIHYVDGDRGYITSFHGGRITTRETSALSASSRYDAGYSAAGSDIDDIIAKLERDPETGKITEKIQIYTHSRGAAFGAGYTSRLLRYIKENSELFADPNDVIDFILNLAPHQSNSIDSPNGADAYSIDRGYDMLSGDDMDGLVGAFKSNAEKGKFGNSHRIKTFKRDLKAFTEAFSESNGDNTALINGFIEKMKSYGITVTVK